METELKGCKDELEDCRLERNKFEVELKAAKEEMKPLQDNEVWELVESPLNQTVVRSKWVYKVKPNGDSKVERYKAWLVA